MPEASASGRIGKVKRSRLAWREGPAPAIANELDRKPILAFLLHLRAFVSLLREIISR
ncbi:hypothetical protein [Bosea sp. (in: a-proteobacteria)]|uniref:hypothetical protein n=1 Tax=Bosea sp. (in: a-proteobacteria) TaxID=1871050 RepID=UPI003340E36D